MSDQFQVILTDLQTMANTFDTEAVNYDKTAGKSMPLPVSTGDTSSDGILTFAMEVLTALNASMQAELSAYGGKLRTAHDAYQRHDIDQRFLYDDLMKGMQ